MDLSAKELLEKLQKTQARQALILELLQGQRKTSEPEVMMRAASEMTGRFLSVDRAGFFELQSSEFLAFTTSWAEGELALLTGGIPAVDIGARYLVELRAGRTLGISDVRTNRLTADSRLGAQGTVAMIGVPLIRGGRWVAGFYVDCATPRNWTADEIALVRDVGEQTWDAVERARAESALRKSEERLTLALEAGGGVGTWDWDMLNDRLYTNARFASMFSVDAQSAAEGVPVSEFMRGIYSEDRERVAAQIQAVIESGQEYSEEYRVVSIDGSVRWVLARGRCHRDEAGRPVRFPGVLMDVTERKQNEIYLRQQWQTFDTALSHTPDHIYIFDADARCRYANRALLDLWQHSLPEAIGKNFFDLDYPAELAHRVTDQIRAVVDTGEPLRDQAQLADQHGVLRSFDYIFVPVLGADGRVESITGSTRDITERRWAEDLVKDDRQRWRDLMERVPAAVVVLRGPEHRIEWCNDEYAALVGRPAERLLGKTVLEALPEVESQIYVKLLDGVYRTGEPFEGHEAMVRMNRGGESMDEMYVNFAYLATRTLAGEIEGILAHIVDVTDMVISRKRTEESEERFRQLADSMPQFVWTARPDGIVDYLNGRWYEYSGVARDADPNESWGALLHPDDLPRRAEAWGRSVASGEPFQMELRRWDPHMSRWRWFMSRAVAARDSSGAVAKWFGTTIDIHDQKISQDALLQTQKLESIGLLAGGIAHDFNNLLVGILGGASFALETLPADHPAFAMLQNTVEASERAAHLTRQMLAYSGKGRFIVEPVDLSAMAKQTRQLISASIPKIVDVRLELDDRLPIVETDSGQMQQVMMNLIINAAEAVGEKNGRVTVRTRAETVRPGEIRQSVDGTVLLPGLYAVLEVEDTGTGIDSETLSKIFDPFFTTKFTGRGLGLAAVSGVVRSNRGALEVETAPGKGSTFRVLLPGSATLAIKTTPRETGRPASGKETILVIDDESVVRNVAKGVLEKAGYCAIVTGDGPAGLEMARRNPEIGLVLLDMSMPGLSGREVMEALKEMSPRLPVVICSGYSDDEINRQFSGMKMAGILQKPFTANLLMSKVRTVLDLHAQKTGLAELPVAPLP